MSISRKAQLIFGVFALAAAANAGTLTFIPQPDITPGTTNYSWFSSGNWFVADAGGNLVTAGRLPQANETAIITGLADATATGVRVQGLLLTNNSAISNGTFAVETIQMQSGSSVNNASVNVLVSLNVEGPNCTLNGSVMNILAFSSAAFAPVPPATSATMILAQGSLLQNSGLLSLTGGSQIIGGAFPQSTLSIGAGAILSSTNLAFVRGSTAGNLLVDNSGLIRVDGGTLRFDNGIDWRCSAGIGEFRSASTNSSILFTTGFHADVGTISLFTGPGTNTWSGTNSIDGTAQVGSIDPGTSAFIAGNLELLSSCSGLGNLHVLGSPTQSAVLNWNNGTFSVASINVDTNGTLLFTGGTGTTRALSGCGLTNSGLCSVLSGDLTLTQGASINNLEGGTFLLAADGTFFGSPAPAGGAFNNLGIFRKTSPGTTQFGDASTSQGPDFNNDGLVDVANGQLNLLGGASSGQFLTEAGAVLWFWGGTHTLDTGVSFVGAGSVRLYQGLSAPQWQLSGSASATELELGPNGLLVGPTNSSSGPITFGTLIANGNGTVSNGTYSIQELEMLDGCTFIDSTIEVSSNLFFGGTNCSLNATTLAIAPSASGTCAPVAPVPTSMLTLAQGSALQISGSLSLAGGSQILAGPSPESTLWIKPAGIMSSTNLTSILGSGAVNLLVDNSGLIRVDGGTLRFDHGVDWHCSAGTGEFRAASPNSSILFATGFHADAGTTSLFTGPGTNTWLSNSSLDGTAQIGTRDPNTLTFSTGNLELLSSCSGLGTLHVLGSPTGSALLNWNNGTLSLTAVNVDTNATLLITGGNGTSRQISGCALNNSGLCSVQSGDLTLTQGASINNLAAGTFQLAADGTFFGTPAPAGGALNNAGTFRKTSPVTSQFGDAGTGQGPDFNNTGLVDLVSGQLNLAGGVSSGQFQTETGAVLWFWGGTHTLKSGATFGGPGSIRLYQGLSASQWLVNGNGSTAELELGTNGTISGPGSLTIGKALYWTNGVIEGTGSLAVSQGASFSIVGSSPKTLLQRGVNNQGEVLLINQAVLACGGGAVLNNLLGGTIDIQTDASLTFNNAGQSLVINNAGSCLKSGGTGTTSIAANFSNSGTFEVIVGTLDFQGSWSQTMGSSVIDSGSVLSGTEINVGGGSIGGTGAIQAKLVNGGLASPGGVPGILSVGSGYDYEQLPSGTLLIELGGRTPGTQYDQLLVGGNAHLDGTLDLHLINGFVPQPGDQFQILNCASQAGGFSQINAPNISKTVWVAHYNGTTVSAVLANELNLGQPVLTGGAIGFAFHTTAGLSYVVQRSISLSSPNWQTLTTLNGDGTAKNVSDPTAKAQCFYRVLIQ